MPRFIVSKTVKSGDIDAYFFVKFLHARVCTGMRACGDSVWWRHFKYT